MINTRCKTECFNFGLDLVSALCFSEYCENSVNRCQNCETLAGTLELLETPAAESEGSTGTVICTKSG